MSITHRFAQNYQYLKFTFNTSIFEEVQRDISHRIILAYYMEILLQHGLSAWLSRMMSTPKYP